MKSFALALISIVLLGPYLYAWQGRVVGITDGDTIRVLRNDQEIKIRLWGIDCPERHQDFGTRARRHTSELAFGKDAAVREITLDRYGRSVALVTLPNGRTLNEELIRSGMAWVYLKYCDRDDLCARWLEFEGRARDQKVGLWSTPNPIPPWEFRKRPDGSKVSPQAVVRVPR